MRSEITKSAVYLGHLKGNEFAFKFDRKKNTINLGMKDQDDVWLGFIKKNKSLYLGQCYRDLKVGLGFLGSITPWALHFNYFGEFNNDKYHGVGIIKEGVEQRPHNFIGYFNLGLKEGLGYSNSEFNTIGIFKDNKKNGIFLCFQKLHSEIFGKSVFSLNSIKYYENDILINTVFLHLELGFEQLFNGNLIEIIYERCKSNGFISECFLSAELLGDVLKIEFVSIKMPYLLKFEINCFEYEFEVEYLHGNCTQIIKESGEQTRFQKNEKDKITLLILEDPNIIKLQNDEIVVEYDYSDCGEISLFSKLAVFEGNKTWHLFKDQQNNSKLKIINDDNETFFSINSENYKEVISIDQLLAVDIFHNNNDKMPWTNDFGYFDGFQSVAYRKILTNNELGIDCTMPYYTFIDTETNGLPKKWLDDSDIEKWPRLIQVAILQYSKDGTLLRKWDRIIYPEEFEVPDDHISGISHEMALQNGEDLCSVLYNLKIFLSIQSALLVCHNSAFDINVLNAEFKRIDSDFNIFECPNYCTMVGSMHYLKSKNYPKLADLYTALFGRQFNNAHNAIHDVEAMANCFWRLKELKAINI